MPSRRSGIPRWLLAAEDLDIDIHAAPRCAVARSARRLILITLAGAVVVLTGCGNDQEPWCSELESVTELEALAAAISTGDVSSANEEVSRFSSVASNAPVEIRSDMQAVADALSEAVGVAMTGDDVDPDDLELRREAVNEQLGRVTPNVAAVSSWAEQECGVRLD